MQVRILVPLTFIALAAVSEAQITPGVFFSNLGGQGSYPQVVNQLPGVWPSCDITDNCITSTLNVPAHNLAPFDEEISLQLRGPLDMTRIAMYQPVNGQYQLVSNWQPGAIGASNMTFLMNGGNDWSICQGNALGFANDDATAQGNTPATFDGYLEGGLELTVMSGVECNGDCGWYRGTGFHGWAGDKIFVIETAMPLSGTSNDMPAVWSLNAQIPRTAQYGCNCGRSGCGEFDIAEVLTNGGTTAHQTIYSYNGNLGSAGYFPRPTSGPSTFVVHYSISDNRIYAVNIPGGCFEYSDSLSSDYIAALHNLATDVNLVSNTFSSNLVGTCPSAPAPAPPAPATTAQPTTAARTTAAPTTAAPTTSIPTTPVPTTSKPTTAVPTTSKPTTNAPTTTMPTTSKPTTVVPTTMPTTSKPTTVAPTTTAPTTSKPTTAPPTTSKPTTNAPTTSKPTTAAPTTSKPTTVAATTTAAPTTTHAPTAAATTIAPVTTHAPTTAISPTTVKPTASACGVLPACGSQCYSASMYSCFNGVLCPAGQLACGNACYLGSMYACANAELVAL